MRLGKTRSTKRIATILLAFLMLLSLMPGNAVNAVGLEVAPQDRAASVIYAPDDDVIVPGEGEGEIAPVEGGEEAAPGEGEGEAAPAEGDEEAAPAEEAAEE